MARRYDHVDVPIVAYRDFDTGLLMISALLDGVEVPLAAHKDGHFRAQLDDAKEQLAAEAEADTTAEPAPPAGKSA